MIELPPFLLFYIAALVAAVLPRAPRLVLMLAVPLNAVLPLLCCIGQLSCRSQAPLLRAPVLVGHAEAVHFGMYEKAARIGVRHRPPVVKLVPQADAELPGDADGRQRQPVAAHDRSGGTRCASVHDKLVRAVADGAPMEQRARWQDDRGL